MSLSPSLGPQFLLRPVAHADLPELLAFAAESPYGLTTLPHDHERLRERIERSIVAFATEDTSGEETYLFVLEDRYAKRLIGTSGIAARAGFADRFYSFRNEFVVHHSKPLGVSTRIHTLHLCHDLTDVSLLTTFYIEPAYEHSLAPQLLSRARLLFMAEHAERFSDRIAAESPGLADDSGRCPFWNAVGRRFFGMEYPEVELLAGGRSKSFIADLMPPSPVYVPLLPEEAQWAIGQLHPVAEVPFSILQDEGFDADTYVDIFDAGPTAQERLVMLKSVLRSRNVGAGVQTAASPSDQLQIVISTSRPDFRACLLAAPVTTDAISLDSATRSALGLAEHDRVRVSALDLATLDPTPHVGTDRGAHP